jgi:thiamine-phosphate pyrophosphorylase
MAFPKDKTSVQNLKKRLVLTLVTSIHEAAPRTIKELTQLAIKGGVTALQLREKHLSGRELFELALDLKSFCKSQNILFIINDRLDLALATEADGLHLGQGDLPAQEARKLWPEPKILGISTSSIVEARKAMENQADYLGVGSMFPTDSKVEAKQIEKETISAINSLGTPTVAIGGITTQNASIVWQQGFTGLAVISALSKSPDPESTARELLLGRNIFLG